MTNNQKDHGHLFSDGIIAGTSNRGRRAKPSSNRSNLSDFYPRNQPRKELRHTFPNLATYERKRIYLLRTTCQDKLSAPEWVLRQIQKLTVDSVVSALGISGREVISLTTSDEIHST